MSVASPGASGVGALPTSPNLLGSLPSTLQSLSLPLALPSALQSLIILPTATVTVAGSSMLTSASATDTGWIPTSAPTPTATSDPGEPAAPTGSRSDAPIYAVGAVLGGVIFIVLVTWVVCIRVTRQNRAARAAAAVDDDDLEGGMGEWMVSHAGSGGYWDQRGREDVDPVPPYRPRRKTEATGTPGPPAYKVGGDPS